MAGKRGRSRAVLAVIIIVIAAVAVYSLLPYVVSTKVSNLHNNQDTYVYGTVEKHYAAGSGNRSVGAFELNDGSGNVWVVWNGTMPSDGQKVLVHGTYHNSSLVVFNLSDMKATNVMDWPV